MKIFREFLLVVIWISLVAVASILLLLLCDKVEAAPLQAPVPPQALVSEYWVIKPAQGSCGCAPNTSCECGLSCTCYGAKPKPKPKPQPSKKKVRCIAPCNFYVPAPMSVSFPVMGGYMGGFGGGCGGGGCGGGG